MSTNGMPFPWQWYGDTIFTILDVIRGIPDSYAPVCRSETRLGCPVIPRNWTSPGWINLMKLGEREGWCRVSTCQQFSKPPISLEVPFPAHSLSTVLVSLSVQQRPFPAPGRFGPGAVVMGLEPFTQVRGPAAVSPIGVADDVDKARHDLH